MHHIHIDDLARDAKAGKADIIERAHASTTMVGAIDTQAEPPVS